MPNAPNHIVEYHSLGSEVFSTHTEAHMLDTEYHVLYSVITSLIQLLQHLLSNIPDVVRLSTHSVQTTKEQ